MLRILIAVLFLAEELREIKVVVRVSGSLIVFGGQFFV